MGTFRSIVAAVAVLMLSVPTGDIDHMKYLLSLVSCFLLIGAIVLPNTLVDATDSSWNDSASASSALGSHWHEGFVRTYSNSEVAGWNFLYFNAWLGNIFHQTFAYGDSRHIYSDSLERGFRVEEDSPYSIEGFTWDAFFRDGDPRIMDYIELLIVENPHRGEMGCAQWLGYNSLEVRDVIDNRPDLHIARMENITPSGSDVTQYRSMRLDPGDAIEYCRIHIRYEADAAYQDELVGTNFSIGYRAIPHSVWRYPDIAIGDNAEFCARYPTWNVGCGLGS